jgi:uncharacterized cofD-like protein
LLGGAAGLLGSLSDLCGGGLLGALARLFGRGLHRPRGPHLVTMGGGTGLAALLRGLKTHSSRITAVVTVADDGGSTGRLRRDFAILAPGDARNCIIALARNEDLLAQIFAYRFERGEQLKGHSLGNLVIAALAEITGDFMQALRGFSEVLAIHGEVMPSTLSNVSLCAEFESGERVTGESQIPLVGKRIRRLSLSPAQATPPPLVLERIAEADLVVLGPGSFYTSIMPNLLVSDVARALDCGPAPVVYVANLMTQPGETDRFTLGDHLEVLCRLTPLRRIDYVVANAAPIEEVKLRYYQSRGSTPIQIDRRTRILLGPRLVEADLVPDATTRRVTDMIRHDGDKLARVLVRLVGRRRQGR